MRGFDDLDVLVASVHVRCFSLSFALHFGWCRDHKGRSSFTSALLRSEHFELLVGSFPRGSIRGRGDSSFGASRDSHQALSLFQDPDSLHVQGIKLCSEYSVSVKLEEKRRLTLLNLLSWVEML